jgi:hypothetical protein
MDTPILDALSDSARAVIDADETRSRFVLAARLVGGAEYEHGIGNSIGARRDMSDALVHISKLPAQHAEVAHEKYDEAAARMGDYARTPTRALSAIGTHVFWADDDARHNDDTWSSDRYEVQE